MVRRFNPPPNWPAPPEGWVPDPSWRPDPAWGPAPEGWNFWLDDEDERHLQAAESGNAASSDETVFSASRAAEVFSSYSMNSRPTGCQTPGMVSRGMPVVLEGIRSATFPVRSARIQGLLEKPVLSDQRLTALHRRPPRRRCRSTRPCPNTRLCRRRPLFRRCSAGNPSRMRDRGSRIRGLRKKASLQGR